MKMVVQIKMYIVHFEIFSVNLIIQMCVQSQKLCKNLTKPGLVGDVKTPVHARTAHTAENIAAVRDCATEEPSTSTRRHAQQLHLSRSSLINIIHEYLHLHAYKVELT
jgi:hypothetical protein